MGIAAIFKKQGGFSLLKNYAYNHVLLYAFCAFLVVPKTKKGLELFRECMSLKIYARIKRKYKKTVEQFMAEVNARSNSLAEKNSKPKVIWFCWLQGIENAPPLVRKCHESVMQHCHGYEIRVVTAQNFSLWADIPDFIIKKWKDGIISAAHFSDILRTALLVKNGGTWIDSTVLFTGQMPPDVEDSSLFLFRTFKPGSDGRCINVSNWFISAQPAQPVLICVLRLLTEYWRIHNRIADYFLYHIFLELIFEQCPDIISDVPKRTNETPHLLLFELGNPYCKEQWNSITGQSFCHKLTHKLDEDVKNREGSFYKHILEEI